MSAGAGCAVRGDATSAAAEAGSVRWHRAAPVDAFPEGGGACVLAGSRQIAVFNFARRGEWFACQNLCPHRRQMALSRGLLGSTDDTPKVACPYHKATFSLETGACLNAELEAIRTYSVRVEDGWVHVGLPAWEPTGEPESMPP
jgi:nitrite reductase (NADH) small subunit